MADYSAPAPELALSEQPQTHIDASVFNRPLRTSIGSGLEQLGAGLEDDADAAAKQQAATDLQKGVTLDANGQPVVATPANSFILGRAGEDYHALMAQGMRAGLQSKVTNDLTELRAQNPTDPQAFAAAAGSYVNKLRTTPGLPPAAANALADQAQDAAAQHHASMVEASMTRDTHEALQTIQTQIGDQRDKLSALARQGATNTPDYDRLQDALQDNYAALTSNPLFGYSKAKAQSELDTTTSQLQADQIVAGVDKAFARKGGDGGRAGAQKMLTDEVLNNPDLHLDDAQRQHFYAQGMAHLEYLTSQNKAQIDANRVTQDKLIETLKSGANVDPTVVGQAITQAQSLGDAEGVMRIQAYAAQARAASAYSGLSDEQRLRVMTGGPGVAAGGYLGALQRQENNTGNPLAGNGGGAYQFTPSTWSRLQQTHPELNLTADGRADPAQGARAIVAFTNDNKAALKAAGIEPTDANTYMAHFLGAAGATSFLKAMAANPNAAAAASNLAAATANPTVFYRGGDPSQPRSLAEVYALQTRRFGGGTTPVIPSGAGGAPSVAQMQANPFAMAAYLDSLSADRKSEVSTAKTVGEAIATRFMNGDTPPPETVAAFQQMQEKHPEELSEIGQKVDTAMRASIAASAAEQMPAGRAAGYMAQIEASKQGGDLNVQARADATKAIYEKSAAALKADPQGEALRRGWIARLPAPLDFSSPEGAAAVPQAMADRAVASAAIAAHTGVAGTSALAPADLPQIGSVMTSGTLDQRTAVLGAITGAGMSEPALRATLGALASSKETLPLAVAGSLTRQNPQAARDILAGQAAMQTEPKLAPNKDDFPSEFAKVLPFNDLAAGPARAGIDAAVQATYAKMSADAGDTTGVLNADRVRKAIDQVTGGVSVYRGSSFIAPWYGAGQSGTEAAIGTLTDADFAGARTGDGKPFAAASLKPSFAGSFTWNNWRLQSYGDGKYLVYNGADTSRQYLAGPQGRFVLDLGAKRAQAERAGLGLADPFGSSLASGAFYGGGN